MTGPSPARRPVRRVAIWSFLALGLVVSIIGPLLPSLQQTFGLSMATVGLLAVINQLGYLLSVFASGLAADRWGRRRVVLLGAVSLLGGALLLAAAPTWPLALAGSGLLGLASGLVDAPMNALINEHSGSERGGDLNLTHGFFGLGAVVGPLLAGGLLTLGLDWRWLLLPVALTALVVIELVRRLHLGAERLSSTGGGVPWPVLRSPVIVVLALILGLYVGLELMIGTWAFSHLRLSFAADDGVAGVATALYWAGITLGRFGAGALGSRLTPRQLIIGNAVAGLVALGLLVVAPSQPLAVAALGLVGLAIANVFPAVVAIAGEAEPHAVGAVSGALITAGALGGTVFPWLVGAIAERAGLAAALAGGLILLVVILGLALLVGLLARRPPPVPAPGEVPG